MTRRKRVSLSLSVFLSNWLTACCCCCLVTSLLQANKQTGSYYEPGWKPWWIKRPTKADRYRRSFLVLFHFFFTLLYTSLVGIKGRQVERQSSIDRELITKRSLAKSERRKAFLIIFFLLLSTTTTRNNWLEIDSDCFSSSSPPMGLTDCHVEIYGKIKKSVVIRSLLSSYLKFKNWFMEVNNLILVLIFERGASATVS